jgi:phosphomannomutase
LRASGSYVLDAGQVPTSIAYFAHRRWSTDAVLIVTASHNPPDYNGLKLMRGELPPTPEDFDRLRQQVEAGDFRRERGKVKEIDPVPAYKAWVMERWKHLGGSAGMVVVLDAGNGAWSELAPPSFEGLGFHVHRLFCSIDGSFPNRSPDCARPASLAALKHEVVRTGAHLGIAWDGDGDRVAFVDGAGSWVSPDEVSALMIRELVSREPGAVVVYDIKLAGIVRQSTVERGGRPMVERSGYTFIKRAMIEQQALFGCEVSGHYFFRELHGGDDGLFAALLMAELLRRHGRSLANLRRTLPPFYVTPDLRIPWELVDYAEVVKRLRAAFPQARESTLDGIRWETPEGYVLARESVTEPVVTVRLEGRREDSLQRLIDLCLKTLPEAAVEISREIEEMRKA